MFDFDNTYAMLPERFFARGNPDVSIDPQLICFNNDLAKELGFQAASKDSNLIEEYFSGSRMIKGSQPLSQAYAGHQFGNWSPQLGDGRACLLGEVIGTNGRRRDIQLKGSGATPWSRNGDGKYALGPAIREYLVSEAMYALGVSTTRSLALVTTGETVYREVPRPGAVLTRVAASHIRVGTFQYFYARRDNEALEILTDYALNRHYPDDHSEPNNALALLKNVVSNQASLIASWLGFGFIHGVMNTDNMAISGETIDFGPCAFMDVFDPQKVFSSIDVKGRYAWGNQPAMAQWNLARFAETLLPMIDPDENTAMRLADDAVNAFSDQFNDQYLSTFGKKLGFSKPDSSTEELVDKTLRLLAENEIDFTLFFRQLNESNGDDPGILLKSMFKQEDQLNHWYLNWKKSLNLQDISTASATTTMEHANPVYIPRNHTIEKIIESAWSGNFDQFREFQEVLSRPYNYNENFVAYESPPLDGEIVAATFCGT